MALLDSEKRSSATDAAADRKPDATTLMLRNIPNKVSEQKLREFLDDTPVRGAYDVVHLPTDAKSGHNRGYAFINFCSAESFRLAMAELRGLRFAAMQSRKVTETSVAHVQGRRAIMRIQSGQKCQKKK
uniref:RRM domain-containing protein n=1 Tax=Oxyrrhis marina TaxID=2969 RepID=A0A7S3XGY6_OXYMA